VVPARVAGGTTLGLCVELLAVVARKNNFESAAKQCFQNYSWFEFERKAL